MPKLTIITINFNHLQGLQRTIDSIIGQSFKDYEWIVVDGGSKDGSKQLLEQYQDRFAWWCSEPDKGVYNAMNKGLAHATGEYVNFMNSGDTFAATDTLENVFSISRSADILYGWMMREHINGELNNKAMMKHHVYWWDFYYYTFNHQATFTRRSLFEKYGGFDETYTILADWHLFARFVGIHHVICEYIPLKIAIYEGGGISETQSSNIQSDLRRIRSEIYPALQEADIPNLYRLALCQRFAFTRWLNNIATILAAKWDALLMRRAKVI